MTFRFKSIEVEMGNVVIPEAVPQIRYKSENGKLFDTKEEAIKENRTRAVGIILGQLDRNGGWLGNHFSVQTVCVKLKELAEVYAQHPDA